MITVEDEFTVAAKEKAEGLKGILLNPHFWSLLKLQEDVLSVTSYESLHYQTDGVTLIGEIDREKEFARNVETMYRLEGKHFTDFLQNTKCTQTYTEMKNYLDDNTNNIPTCTTLQMFEMSRYRSYKGHCLSTVSAAYPPLSSYLNDYIKEILRLHVQYFTKEEPILKLFNILDVSKWKQQMPLNQNKHMETLGQILAVRNARQIRNDWESFREELMLSSVWCADKDSLKSNPAGFWTYILNSNKFEKLTKPIGELIQHVLSIAIGSASAERM